jgi:hypothetical protein
MNWWIDKWEEERSLCSVMPTSFYFTEIPLRKKSYFLLFTLTVVNMDVLIWIVGNTFFYLETIGALGPPSKKLCALLPKNARPFCFSSYNSRSGVSLQPLGHPTSQYILETRSRRWTTSMPMASISGNPYVPTSRQLLPLFWHRNKTIVTHNHQHWPMVIQHAP